MTEKKVTETPVEETVSRENIIIAAGGIYLGLAAAEYFGSEATEKAANLAAFLTLVYFVSNGVEKYGLRIKSAIARALKDE